MCASEGDTAAMRSKPYENEDLLRRLYQEEKKSMLTISKELDCSASTVAKYLDKFGVERRTASEQISLEHGNGPTVVPFETRKWGGEAWRHSYRSQAEDVYVHRLLAVAKYGFDAVCGMDVHHKSGVTWDNRYENIELMTPEDHRSHHKKLDVMDRIRVAELYENGDVSYRKLHELVDYDHVTWHTLMHAHHELYGGPSSAK